MGLGYRLIWQLLEPRQKRSFAWLVLLMILTGLFDIAGVALVVPFLTVMSNPSIIFERPFLSRLYELAGFESSFGFLQALGAAIFVMVIAGIAVRTVTFYLTNRFTRDIAVSLSHRRLSGYLGKPYEWFLTQHSAHLAKSVLEEISEIVNNIIAPAIRLIVNGFLMLLLGLFLIWVEPLGAAVIGGAFSLGFGGVYWLLGARLGEMGEDRLRANRERHQMVGEALGGIKEVKVMGLERYYLSRFLAPSYRLARHHASLSLIGELPRYALEALIFGGMLLFVLFLLWMRGGDMQQVIPVIGAFAFTAIKLMPTAQILFRDLSLARFGQPALAELAADLSVGPRDARPTELPPELALHPGREAGEMMQRELRLQGASYRYPGAGITALERLDLSVPKGARIGIAGSTGAGKTTLIDLILGLIVPHEGNLLIDGVPLTGPRRTDWQARLGYVPQTIHLVDDTVLANIARGIPAERIDRDAARRAIVLAGIEDVVEALPQGIDTMIGEGGLRLSGGQRQRLGIARALYRRPEMLILDEATSALDAVTETRVLDAVNAMEGCTTVMISHRLTSLAQCDHIYFLEHGVITAQGDFDDLRRDAPAFRAMLEAAE
ncbi:ABC transporter ATP-binding protein [Profundibacterium mesophilum]|uniref:ABC transporter ATP-binding protein n=1 Tax=Profundibacterium mesophilum KAUST100406-0324 TaxID=1037889 RepID=A0A921NV77_9RHOB|nr:ABC transporter ATP-binding protein [Profundibacterium mesophilum]KAF0675881.1 ABC transporter ATP-binding protein [Profundibacterium mesophilum KAUST100406-0324]